MLLSIGMMVKDEEIYLEKCLQGLKPILDSVDSELIIVDTGSTDSTVDIAKKYTNRVYHHEWTDHFGEMRNTVLKYAKGQWFFFIDADEIIDDHADIVKFFTSKRHKKANAAFFLLKNLLSKEDNGSYGYAHMLRFFRNDKAFHFRGAVHEQPVYKPPVAHIKASAVHYGYLNDDAGLMEYKYKRNVEILEKELEKNPENVYYWFQLAQSYGMYGDKDKGLDAILKAYSLMKADKKPEYRMSVYLQLAQGYLGHGMYKEAVDVCNEGCRLREGYFDLYYFRAMSQFELGDYEDSLKSFSQYLKGVDKFRKNEGLVDFSVPYMTVRFYDHVLHYVSVIYKKLEDYKKSLEYADKIKDKKVYRAAIPHVVEIYMEKEWFEGLKALYESKVAEDEDYDEVFLNAFEVYRQRMSLQQKKRWSQLFAGEASDYALLNSIRLLDDTDEISPSLIERIRSLDWRKAPVFYSELIWALIRRNKAIISIINGLQEYKFNALLEHIAKSSRWFASKLLNYFKDQCLWQNEKLDPETLRVKVIMLRSILVFDGLSEADYEAAFDEYIADGIANIRNIYNQDVIENEKVSFMKTSADAFMLYVYKALECFDSNKVGYVRYLRKALDADNQMKKGIQILQERISERIGTPQNELEQHKRKVLGTIEDAINGGNLETARVLISEYENIVGVDAKLCSIKAVLLLIEQDLDGAEEVLLEGLGLDSSNVDLLFNMGYLSELKGRNLEASKYYLTAKPLSDDTTLVNEIDEALMRVKVEAVQTIDNNVSKAVAQQLSRPDALARDEASGLKDNTVKILYLGWLGKGNVGDDLLYDVFKTLLYSRLPEVSDKVLVDPFLPNQSYVIDLSKYDLVVLGGGSLLGLPYWRDIMLKADRLNIPTIVWGSGFDVRKQQQVKAIVQEYETQGKRFKFRQETAGEMVKLASLAGVRGKLDKLLIGNDKVQVIGDPGVIWKDLNQPCNIIPEVEGIPDGERIIPVNWGTSLNNIVGNNEETLRKELKRSINVLAERGYRIVVYPIWTEDIKPCKQLVYEMDNENIILIERVYDVNGIAYLMQRAHITINFKLHANILSAAYNKPFVSLAYGLKCYDFADSINFRETVLFTDDVKSDDILEKVEYIEENYEGIQLLLEDAHRRYFDKQLTFMDELIELLFKNKKQSEN